MSVKRNKTIVALLLVVSMVMTMLPMSSVQAVEESIPKQGWYNTEENTGDMNRVPYNNPSQIADLNMGMCSYPVVVDMNEDGIMDLLVYGGAQVEEQVKIFYGTEEGGLVMEKGRKLNLDGYATYPFTATYFYDEEGNYEKTGLHIAGLGKTGAYDAKDYPITDEDTPIITRDGVNIYQWTDIDGNKNTTTVSSLSTLVDFDGDGVLDCINEWDSWYENGWRYGMDSRYDEEGIWGAVAGTTGSDKVVGLVDGENDSDGLTKDGDPLHGWVAWSKNTGSDTAQSYSGTELIQVYEYTGSGDERAIVEGSGKALDVFGAPTVSFSDWDKDGDLDMIAGCWLNDLTYFENIGTRTAPIYITGRPVEMPNGEPVQTDMCQVVTSGFDWDNDGDMDLIIGEEDGRVSFIECVGVTAEGTPIMEAPVRFQAYADSLDFGTLISIDSVDWDGDGDEDIVAGEDSGRISMIKNVTIEKGLKEGKKKEEIDLSNPIWGEQIYLTNPKGEVYRIVAGYNGSLQGTSEELFGYSKIDTGDWDGDGVLDIISNSIWGIILFHKGIKTTDGTFKAENPVPIEVDWENGVKYPQWNWWAPGEETLGVDVTDPAGRVYKAQWPWWNDVKSENELVVQWRTSPCLLDNFPIKDPVTGQVRYTKGLAVIDYEGYLSFYEQYQDGNTYKLKEGQRIFMEEDGVTPIKMVEDTNTYGTSGRRQFILADYNADGQLDYIANNGVNMGYRPNTGELGEYKFTAASTMHSRKISLHVPSPTVCDWDQDGYLDVLMGDEGGNVYYLRNTIYHKNTGSDNQENDDEQLLTGVVVPDGYTRVTPKTFGIKNGQVAYVAGVDSEFSSSKPLTSLDKVLFETKVNCDVNTGSVYYANFHLQHRFSGRDLRVWMPSSTNFWVDNKENDYTYEISPSIAFQSDDTMFIGKTYILSITSEYVDYDGDTDDVTGEAVLNDVKLGFWFNGKLYNDKYIYLCDMADSFVQPSMYFQAPAVGSIVTYASPSETLEGFYDVTPVDFGLADGTVTDTNTLTGNDKPVLSLDKVRFQTTVKYEAAGCSILYANLHIQTRYGDGKTRIWTPDNSGLNFWEDGIEGTNYIEMSAAIAFESTDTTFIGKEYHFAITTEYVDCDGDLDENNNPIQNDLKIGLWFNGQLYDETYFYVYDYVTETLTAPSLIFRGNGAGAVITYSSQDDGFKGFKYVTPKDFGIEDGTYTVKKHTTSPLSTFDKVLFEMDLEYLANGTYLYFGKMAFQLRDSAKNLYLWFLEQETTKPYVNGTVTNNTNFKNAYNLTHRTGSYQNQPLKLSITMEYVDYDRDHNQDDIKVGVWFDNVLYGGRYIYDLDYAEIISSAGCYFNIAQNSSGAGEIKVASPSICEMEMQPEITDSIALNYTATINPMFLKTADVSMKFEMNGRDAITIEGVPTTEGGNVFTYKYTDIMGQDMADKIGLTVNVGSDSKYYEYSVLDYCVDVLNDKYDTYSAETKELIVDLVEYGAALQTYRGVAEKYLFTKQLEEKVPNYTKYDKADGDVQSLAGLTAVEEKMTTEQTASETENYAWYSVGLVLNNKVKIRAKFTASDISNLTVKAVIDSVELEDALEIQGTSTAGVYQVDFDDIYAYEYAKQISFRVYEGDAHVGQTLNYSVNTYLKEMHEHSAKLATLLVAINNYGNAAKAYQFPE